MRERPINDRALKPINYRAYSHRLLAEHGEVLTGQLAYYHEVAPQLVLMAFLRRVVNGGGFVDSEHGREYGVGRGRIDLLVRWPLSLP